MTKNIMTTLKELSLWSTRHEADDERRFSEISNALVDMKDNHLAHIQTDMWWVKWLVMGEISGLGLLLVGIISAIITGYIGH